MSMGLLLTFSVFSVFFLFGAVFAYVVWLASERPAILSDVAANDEHRHSANDGVVKSDACDVGVAES